jgi:hypothetical protein
VLATQPSDLTATFTRKATTHAQTRPSGLTGPSSRSIRPCEWARSPALSLTWEESRHIYAAIANIARAYGGLDVLAVVLGTGLKTLYTLRKPCHRIGGTFAIRLASAAGMIVDHPLRHRRRREPVL